jgi:geranylgeranyl diphosphate synthase type II
MPAAAALEMLHTYSLIHDDLPSIDNDDLRRGRPTCHKKFGDATAILAGDALQTQAFQVLAERTPRADVISALVLELARAAGSDGMVGGEIADIEAEGQQPDRATVEFIHEKKTAALIRAAVVMGGIAAGGDDAQIEALRAFGTRMGLAFQIVDDVLDETGTAESLGKSPGKDRAAGKMSYPAVVGLDESRQRARGLAEEAIAALSALPVSEKLASLAAFTVTRVK